MSSVVNKSSTRFKPRQPSRGPVRKSSNRPSIVATPDEYTRLPGLSGAGTSFGSTSMGFNSSNSSATTPSRAIRNKIHFDLAEDSTFPLPADAKSHHRKLLDIVQSSENEGALTEDDSPAAPVASKSGTHKAGRPTIAKIEKPSMTSKVSGEASSSKGKSKISISANAEDTPEIQVQESQVTDNNKSTGDEEEADNKLRKAATAGFGDVHVHAETATLRRSTRLKHPASEETAENTAEPSAESVVSTAEKPLRKRRKTAEPSTTTRTLRNSKKADSDPSKSGDDQFKLISFSQPLRPRTSNLRGNDDDVIDSESRNYAELAGPKASSDVPVSASASTSSKPRAGSTSLDSSTVNEGEAAGADILTPSDEELELQSVINRTASGKTTDDISEEARDATWELSNVDSLKPRKHMSSLPMFKPEPPRVDDKGRVIIGHTEIQSRQRIDDAEAANRVLDTEKVLMSDVCGNIPVGVASSKHEKLMEITRRRRREQMMLRDQRLMVRSNPKSLFEFRTELQKRDAARRQQNQQEAKDKLLSDANSGAAVVPKLRIGEGGSFSVDVESTVVDRHRNNALDEGKLERVDADDIGMTVNSGSYSRHERPERWYPEETDLFYKAISMWGTDFNLISKLFPGRSRRQVKSKYKLEERKNPAKLHLATIRKLPVDMTTYTESLNIQDIHIRDVDEVVREIDNVKQEFQQRLREDAEALKRSKEEDAANADKADRQKVEQRASETFQSTLNTMNSVSVKRE